MTDKMRTRLMWGSLIANSVLIGLLALLMVTCVLTLCEAVDQGFPDRRLPAITEWVMAWQPRELETMCWLASAVAVTCFFLSYCFCPRFERPSGPALCLSAYLVVILVAASYFFLCVLALAISKVNVRGGMRLGTAEQFHPSHMKRRTSWLPVNVWGAATAGYTIGLLALGLSIRRKRMADGEKKSEPTGE